MVGTCGQEGCEEGPRLMEEPGGGGESGGREERE